MRLQAKKRRTRRARRNGPSRRSSSLPNCKLFKRKRDGQDDRQGDRQDDDGDRQDDDDDMLPAIADGETDDDEAVWRMPPAIAARAAVAPPTRRRLPVAMPSLEEFQDQLLGEQALAPARRRRKLTEGPVSTPSAGPGAWGAVVASRRGATAVAAAEG